MKSKSIAHQGVTDGFLRDGEHQHDLDDEEGFFESSSSPSLESHSHSPPYHELAPTMMSDYEDGAEDLHTTPVRMVHDGGALEDQDTAAKEPDVVIQEPGARNVVAAQEASLEE